MSRPCVIDEVLESLGMDARREIEERARGRGDEHAVDLGDVGVRQPSGGVHRPQLGRLEGAVSEAGTWAGGEQRRVQQHLVGLRSPAMEKTREVTRR